MAVDIDQEGAEEVAPSESMAVAAYLDVRIYENAWGLGKLRLPCAGIDTGWDHGRKLESVKKILGKEKLCKKFFVFLGNNLWKYANFFAPSCAAIWTPSIFLICCGLF